MSVAGTVLMNAKRLLDAQEHHVDQLWQQLAVVLNDDALPARERFDLVVKSCFDAEATPVEGSALLEARRTLHDEGFERFLQSSRKSSKPSCVMRYPRAATSVTFWRASA
jgi:hypothetical protein